MHNITLQPFHRQTHKKRLDNQSRIFLTIERKNKKKLIKPPLFLITTHTDYNKHIKIKKRKKKNEKRKIHNENWISWTATSHPSVKAYVCGWLFAIWFVCWLLLLYVRSFRWYCYQIVKLDSFNWWLCERHYRTIVNLFFLIDHILPLWVYVCMLKSLLFSPLMMMISYFLLKYFTDSLSYL